MKVKLLARANEYDAKGWTYTFDEDLESTWYDQTDTYVELGVVDLPEPKLSQLVSIGLAKTKEMEEDREREAQRWEEKIKEYESKFLMLESPSE